MELAYSLLIFRGYFIIRLSQQMMARQWVEKGYKVDVET